MERGSVSAYACVGRGGVARCRGRGGGGGIARASIGQAFPQNMAKSRRMGNGRGAGCLALMCVACSTGPGSAGRWGHGCHPRALCISEASPFSSPCLTLRLRGGNRVTGFKRRENTGLAGSRRIHSIMRPRNARRRAERLEQARASAGDAAAVGEMEGDEGDPRSLDAETNPVNRNLFRRNMGEWVVAMDNFKKAHPALYEEELNTRADAEACFFVRQWREALELPDDDEEELDKRMNDPDWIRKRGIAHYNLAMCHDTGFVVGMSEKKPEVAYAHYLAAAELGHPEAMCCVGSSLMYGNGVAQDVDAAAEWYVRAALEGHVDGSYDAMFNLGTTTLMPLSMSRFACMRVAALVFVRAYF